MRGRGQGKDVVAWEQFKDLLCIAKSQYNAFNTVHYTVKVAVYLLNKNDDRQFTS